MTEEFDEMCRAVTRAATAFAVACETVPCRRCGGTKRVRDELTVRFFADEHGPPGWTTCSLCRGLGSEMPEQFLSNMRGQETALRSIAGAAASVGVAMSRHTMVAGRR